VKPSIQGMSTTVVLEQPTTFASCRKAVNNVTVTIIGKEALAMESGAPIELSADLPLTLVRRNLLSMC
jgi:hypothetical protein